MPSVIKYLQLPFQFDVKLLQQDLQSLTAKHWLPHYQTLHYTGNWSAIPLRSQGGNTSDIIISPYAQCEYKDTEYLQASPYFKNVLSFFKCPLQSVRLLKLDAGAIIKEHRDIELNFENGEIRIHIPVITHEAVEFFLDKERINLKEGECWYCNFNLPHSISNKSSVNRVHLVIDAKVNDWVKEIFLQDHLIKKEINLDDELTEATKLQMIERLKEMNTATSLKMADDLERSLAQ